jgi:hypothetical protein
MKEAKENLPSAQEFIFELSEEMCIERSEEKVLRVESWGSCGMKQFRGWRVRDY